MKSRDEIVLEKILKYISQIEDAYNDYGYSFEAFTGSSVYRNACCMCILQIGELCKVLTNEFRERESVVPWKNWCGIRDIFAHQYGEMDFEVAWNTLEDDLPYLKKNVIRILNQMKEDKTET